MKHAFIAASSLLVLTSVTTSVSAQEAEAGGFEEASVTTSDATANKLRVYAGLRLGAGGEATLDPDGGTESDDDLLATFGFQAGADYGLHEYFAAGLELRFAGTNSDDRDDADIGRDLFVDIDVKPRGRYTLSSVPLELYGTLPFGLTLINTNDDLEDAYGGADVSAGPGFNLGLGAGATYLFTPNWGVNFEMAYLWYWYGMEAKQGGAKSEADVTARQFTMMLNGVYAINM